MPDLGDLSDNCVLNLSVNDQLTPAIDPIAAKMGSMEASAKTAAAALTGVGGAMSDTGATIPSGALITSGVRRGFPPFTSHEALRRLTLNASDYYKFGGAARPFGTMVSSSRPHKLWQRQS